MMDERSLIRDAIKIALHTVQSSGKTADKILKPAIAQSLKAQGFGADQEDTRGMMERGLPVWRSKDSGEIESTSGRRRVDIVVYSKNGYDLIGLIETESDLDDLRPSGVVNRRSGHYDVYSIAGQENGSFFESYKSLERMAALVFYRSSRMRSDRDFSPMNVVQDLEQVRSDSRTAHNPTNVPLFLVSAQCRKSDLEMLDARCRSVGAEVLWQRILGLGSSCPGSFAESHIKAF